MKSLYTALALLTLILTPLHAEWDIEKPTKDIPAELTGEIFGKDFELGEAVWGQSALSITSKNKLGSWPESQLIIFIPNAGEESEWHTTPDTSDSPAPHIHMKFTKKVGEVPSALTFTSEYSLYLKVVERSADEAQLEIHLSLPDYKKSFLLGKFAAKING